MAWIWADRVLDTSVTAGTVSLVVSGTSPLGWRTFSTVCAVADTFYYTIYDPITGAWETGEGTYSATNTVARTTVRASSNAGALVNFAANAKNVFIDVIGYWFGTALPSEITVAAGAVAYGDTTGTAGVTGDLTNFAWDATNKRLGIGITAPTTTLDVRGVLNATGVYPVVTKVGTLGSSTRIWNGLHCSAGATHYGATSGTATLIAPAVAGTTTITLPATTGQLAMLASPTFTGTPAAPTATAGTNTTQLATTAFVDAAVKVIALPAAYFGLASGYASGYTGGVWLTITINTTVFNDGAGALAANVWTPGAGTWMIDAGLYFASAGGAQQVQVGFGISKNNEAAPTASQVFSFAYPGQVMTLTAPTLIKLTGSDNLRLKYHVSGSDPGNYSIGGSNLTYIRGVRVAP